MSVLLQWQDDWYVGYPFGDLAYKSPEQRFLLVGGNRVVYINDALTPRGNPWLHYFSRDPGFAYYPIIRYRGQVVSPVCIRIDGTLPREVFIMDRSNGLWSTSVTAADGTTIELPRFVSISDLEKEEGKILGSSGNWGLPV